MQQVEMEQLIPAVAVEVVLVQVDLILEVQVVQV